MKESWLTLYPNTFIWSKNGVGLIYNSTNYRFFTFKASEVLNQLYDELVEIDNLYCASINDEFIDLVEVQEFINNVIAIEAGILTEKRSDASKPVSYLPVLNIQKNVDVFRIQDKANTQTQDIFNNLTTLTFHINGDKNIDSLFHTQFTAPFYSTDILPISSIKCLLKPGKGYIAQWNVVGDFANYPDMDSLLLLIDETPVICNLYATISSWLSADNSLFPRLSKKEKVQIIVIVSNNELSKVGRFLENSVRGQQNVCFIFPITLAKEYEEATTQIEKYNIASYTITPLYNGENLSFFEELVFTDQEDINHSQFCKREIFSHLVINTNFFGELIVMPNQEVRSNINNPPIGTVDAPLYDLIYTELDTGNSWRMIRDKEPCSNCIYQWLCPSPSNYELVIGRPNLCSLTPV